MTSAIPHKRKMSRITLILAHHNVPVACSSLSSQLSSECVSLESPILLLQKLGKKNVNDIDNNDNIFSYCTPSDSVGLGVWGSLDLPNNVLSIISFSCVNQYC